MSSDIMHTLSDVSKGSNVVLYYLYCISLTFEMIPISVTFFLFAGDTTVISNLYL